MTVHAFVAGTAALLTPVLMAVLSRVFPPPSLTPAEYDELSQRHHRTELWSRVVCIAALWVALTFAVTRHQNTPWLLGVVFGWMVAAPVFFIAARTLPSGGLSRWREFWLFYACRYRVNLWFVACLYAACTVLAILSTAKLFLVPPA